jgi:phenylalanyl-tRNA synthetase beta chain
MEKHPDADHLMICQVDIGTETTQIVTGAPNVRVGMLTPVVLPGGKVAGGHDGSALPEDGIEIKDGNLRGVPSHGMMCSIEELGSSREFYPEAPENGIYEFAENDGVKPGDDAIEALGLHDVNFEYEITSNRVDCYSVIGIAREAAATFGKRFIAPVIKETGNGEDVNDYIKVDVQDTDLCPRYVGRVVKNIKLAPSPKWMQRCLASNGIRPINNIVDITNYVMEELGQPMHAYDLDTIAGGQIIVRRADEGEKFVTLDGKEHVLDSSILTIRDAEKAVGLAGIMGGENSMITDSVKTILFEAACFDGTNIRLSAKKIGNQTDASRKFDKGLDPNTAMDAINRACQLIEEFGAGEVVGGAVDVYPEVRMPSRVKFDPEKINAMLGTDISREDQLAYLAAVELTLDEATREIVAPTFRQDIHRLCDVAEEVARFYGYDNIPTTLPRGEATAGKLSFKNIVEGKARDVAEYCGFSQGMCYSFESPKVFDKLNLAADDPARKAVEISNPLGEDFSVMRTLSLNGMLTSLATNYNRRNKNVHLYELGNIYLPKQLPVTELPEERMQFTLGFYGDGDFYTMKGVVEEFRTGLAHRRAPAGRHVLPVGIVELDLHEIPVIDIQQRRQRGVAAMEGEAQVPDPSRSALLQDIIKDAVVAEAPVEFLGAGHVVQEEEIDKVHLEVLQRILKHLPGRLVGRLLAAEGHVGHLGRDLVAVAGVAAQGLARHDFRLPIDRSRVEIIHAVGDGIVNHLVHGLLVQVAAVSESGAAALGGQRRETHAAQAEHPEGLPHLAPGP